MGLSLGIIKSFEDKDFLEAKFIKEVRERKCRDENRRKELIRDILEEKTHSYPKLSGFDALVNFQREVDDWMSCKRKQWRIVFGDYHPLPNELEENK